MHMADVRNLQADPGKEMVGKTRAFRSVITIKGNGLPSGKQATG
jgi:hypothetical protein